MAAVGSQITPLRAAPVVGMVALKAAAELNDILNALGLRVALLRHRSNPTSPPSADMERLSGLVDKAVECVRNLQDYIRAEQLVGAIRNALSEQQIDAAHYYRAASSCRRLAALNGRCSPRSRPREVAGYAA